MYKEIAIVLLAVACLGLGIVISANDNRITKLEELVEDMVELDNHLLQFNEHQLTVNELLINK